MGNIIWNQFAPELNSDNYAPYNPSNVSASFDGGVGTMTWLVDRGAGASYSIRPNDYWLWEVGHISYFSYEINPSFDGAYWSVEFGGGYIPTGVICPANTWTRLSFIGKNPQSSAGNKRFYIPNRRGGGTVPKTGDTCSFRNPIFINLTTMFGAGNEPLDVEYFEYLCAINGVDVTKAQPYEPNGVSKNWLLGKVDQSLFSARRRILINTPHVESTSGTIAKPETDMTGKIKECKIHFMPVQQGDSDPTPDNIVPVTGWTGIDVYSTGKNLFNLNVPVGLPSPTDASSSTNRIFTPYTVIKGTSGTNYYSPGAVNSYSINDDILTVNSRSDYGVGFAIKIKPNQTYTISGSADSEYGAVAISTYSRDGKFTKIREVSRFIHDPYYSFNTNSQADMLVLTFYAPSGGYNIDIHYSNIQLEIGNTVTEYEPYKGNIISANWENEIGTIYGGYIDLISGELVQEWAEVDLGTLTWIAKDTTGDYNYFYSTDIANNVDTSVMWFVSALPSVSNQSKTSMGTNVSANNSFTITQKGVKGSVVVRNDDCETPSEFQTWVTGIKLVYPMQTPITTQLTPQQLTTLRGINNIWSSANGEVEIKYWTH